MKYIVTIAVIGILLLQWAGGIPSKGVGGAMTIALAILIAAIATGMNEAWTRRRGVIGWIISVVVATLGAILSAPLVGMIMALLLGPFLDGPSLAATGGIPMAIALAGTMLLTLLGSWTALWLVNRLR